MAFKLLFLFVLSPQCYVVAMLCLSTFNCLNYPYIVSIVYRVEWDIHVQNGVLSPLWLCTGAYMAVCRSWSICFGEEKRNVIQCIIILIAFLLCIAVLEHFLSPTSQILASICKFVVSVFVFEHAFCKCQHYKILAECLQYKHDRVVPMYLSLVKTCYYMNRW